MKIRTLTVGLLAACLITESAFAQLSAITDATKDAIIISGAASSDETQILLLKPGFSAEDAESAAASDNKSALENVIEYFGQATAKDGNIEMHIPMRADAEKGKYMLVVDNASTPIYYATLSDRMDNMIPTAKEALKNGTFAQFASSDGKYFCNSSLYDALSKPANVAKYSEEILSGAEFSGDPELMQKMTTALNTGIIMEALNEGKVSDIDIIKSMTDDSGMTVSYEKIDLIEKDKQKNIISDVSGKNFASSDDYEKLLSESIFMNVLYYAKDMTNEDKKVFFEAYAGKLGLNLSNYNKLSANKKSEAIAKLIAANDASLKLLQSSLDDICEGIASVTTNTNSGGGGGGSSGGGASSGESGIRAVYGNAAVSAAGGLTDLSQCEWARPAIEFLVNNNMISGYEDNTFKPSKNISRAEFISIIARKYLPQNSFTQSFSDVASGSWYFDHVESAYNNGIISGKDNDLFAPNENISRQDMAVILYRLAGFLGHELTGEQEAFADDYSIAEYSRDAIYSLRAAGIVNGDEKGCFNPNSAATRAEAAQMIYGFVKYLALGGV